VAPPSQDSDPTFGRTVVLVVDREPNGITTGIALNRRLQTMVLDTSALALLFVPEPGAHAYWGGPMGSDPAIVAEFTTADGLEWFHLDFQQRRPFPLANVGVIAVAEHPSPFEGRIRRARLFIGLCVWGRGQLQAEVDRGEWRLLHATADDVFYPRPDTLWQDLQGRIVR
jgi:putative transcriptional regulator